MRKTGSFVLVKLFFKKSVYLTFKSKDFFIIK